MKDSKFSEVQIIKILSEQNPGKTVNEICREHGISQPTIYKWKSKYGGLDVQQLAKMKELQKVYEYLGLTPEQIRNFFRKAA